MASAASGFSLATSASSRTSLMSVSMSLPSAIGDVLSQEKKEFAAVMDAIEDSFEFRPVPFQCGELASEAGTNSGSAKIFSLGKLAELDEAQTLALFGQYYQDVKDTPDGDDHGNIRNFMKSGWAGVDFPAGLALIPKGSAYEYEASQEMY